MSWQKTVRFPVRLVRRQHSARFEGHEENVLANSYRELVLAVGETIRIGTRRLTLLDIEGELGLFQLDADDQYTPLSGEELYEVLAADGDSPGAPR